MEGKVLSVLEWVESLLPMQRSKEKQETGSDISILKHEIISLLNIHILLPLYWVSLAVQMVKNMPTLRETWAQSLGWEDPLEVGMATYSNILAWTISMDRGAWQATVHGIDKSRTQLTTSTTPLYYCMMYYCLVSLE